MKLAMLGLGRMGANMVRRLLRAGHACTVYDPRPEAAVELAAEGATAARDLAALVAFLPLPRVVWVMVPAETVDTVLAALFSRFSSRGESEFADKLLSALRNEFGGHREPPKPS